ncbi:MAG: single-stranded-DNA-specific exonuclease RecJ [Candidatus Riflebacteria bacterium]|nr:single-stranded-DNA-specific exonuclease RecJ [Candidatus Riflebacteria bacterium]
MTDKIWKLKEVSKQSIDRLKSTGFSDILIKILINRGITDLAAVERYFNPKSRYLFSPFIMDNICTAIDRILKATENNESIRVYGDRDVDGITSTVVLTETLKSFYDFVDYTVPVIEDGYGLNPGYIDVAAKDGISLIITVDCGISNHDEVDYAKSKGIDVIVTDHHEPPAQTPKAVALVDPKLRESLCPQKNIAGVAVAFKLSMALEMARCKKLAKPLIAFDLSNDDITIVRFSPREGFTTLKNVNPTIVANSVPLFFNVEEKNTIGNLVPSIGSLMKNPNNKPIFVSSYISEYLPDAVSLSKEELKKTLNLDHISGGKSLLLLFLKCVEAGLPAIKQLWIRCLDILTIGTVADMVPLQGENRTFTQMGLKFVSKTKRMGLASLFTALGWKNKQVTEKDIRFSIAPILNSSGRLKTAELAIELLGTSKSSKSDSLAKQLYELNSERKRLGEECYKGVKQYLGEQNDLENDKILMVAAPMKNLGVTGIVATRLMLDYSRPVIVLLEDQGKFLGSARSFKNINIIEALNYCSDSLEKYGGHVGAAGLTMLPEKVDRFREQLREFSAKNISIEDLKPEWEIDSEVLTDDIDENFLAEILKFAPFGIDNPAPIFMIKNAQFHEIKKVGENKNHLRFKFKRSNGRSLFGIGFSLGDLMVPEFIRDGTCDIVFHVEPNDYNGVRTAQLMILDCRLKGFK